ncbi:MAG: hypothetical protein K5655_03390 [Lachnospiraceae bacterium]|nr:hypothetical protein [Lachnospiraceae bacterium]
MDKKINEKKQQGEELKEEREKKLSEEKVTRREVSTEDMEKVVGGNKNNEFLVFSKSIRG